MFYQACRSKLHDIVYLRYQSAKAEKLNHVTFQDLNQKLMFGNASLVPNHKGLRFGGYMVFFKTDGNLRHPGSRIFKLNFTPQPYKPVGGVSFLYKTLKTFVISDGSKGGGGSNGAPPDQNFLNFMQFLGKFVCWRLPPTGNPGSAPGNGITFLDYFIGPQNIIN